jgi:Flp pilus assembly protein TadG
MQGTLSRLNSTVRNFAKRKDGAAAVEFALVVPFMLTLYFGTMELSQGLEINKKVGRASSLIADLVTQQAIITKSEVVAIAGIAEATLAPYKRTKPTVEVVGIQVTDEPSPKAKVAWSVRVANGASSSFLTAGSEVVIPTELMLRNTFIVRGALKIDYIPVTVYTINSPTPSGPGISMGEVYHLRPRTSPTVSCPDC